MAMLPLAGKTALITGSSSGIGAAVALHLSSLGANVVINYATNAGPANALVAQMGGASRALAVRADAGNTQDVSRLVDEALAWGGGKIDILIPNAALGAAGKGLENTEEEEWDRTMGVNVKGVWWLVKVCSYPFPFSL